MRILLDCDGVLGDFPAGVLWFCNLYGRSRGRPAWTHDDIHQHDILKALGITELQPRLDQWMADSGFCRQMPIYPGAQEFVETLRGCGHEVVIVTASYTDVPTWESQRRAWLAEHFEIPKQDVIFAKRKELIRGHWLVDDKSSNCKAFSEYGLAMCFDRPWNQEWPGIRASSHLHALGIIGPP